MDVMSLLGQAAMAEDSQGLNQNERPSGSGGWQREEGRTGWRRGETLEPYITPCLSTPTQFERSDPCSGGVGRPALMGLLLRPIPANRRQRDRKGETSGHHGDVRVPGQLRGLQTWCVQQPHGAD